MTSPQSGQLFHASCVSFGGRAVLITGSSGAGKSTLAIDLLSRGAELVSDDQTQVHCDRGVIIANPPPAIKGKIEAFGVGILAADYVVNTPVKLIADLDKKALVRMPENEPTDILGVSIETINGAGLPNLAAIVILYLKGGRLS